MRHNLDNLLMWVSIILNETDGTMMIIIMMVMMMEKGEKSAILFHAQVLKY